KEKSRQPYVVFPTKTQSFRTDLSEIFMPDSRLGRRHSWKWAMFGSKADISQCPTDVRFTPESGLRPPVHDVRRGFRGSRRIHELQAPLALVPAMGRRAKWSARRRALAAIAPPWSSDRTGSPSTRLGARSDDK